jgi:thymidylate synthase
MRIPGLELEPVWMPRAPLELDGRGPAGDPGQRVVGDTLSEVWRGVLAECLRFGVAVPTHYGATRDLHNLVSVIRDPEASLTEIIAGEVFDLFGWGWEDVKGYARRLSTGELPEGVSYSYGSRMVDGVGGEGVDQVAWMREQLAADPDYRGIYLTPWLPGADIGEGKGRPCLVGLLWRRQDGRLHLTATFRSHDLFEGYPQNAAGLACWLGDEAAAACLDVGTLTILSSSAHLYERDWSAAQRAAFSRASTMVDLDRRSCWRVYLDGGSLVAEGLTPDGDTVLARFAGPSVGNVAHRIHRSGLVSSISGALWLGGELERVWAGRLR